MRAVAPAILVIWRARWLPEGSRRSRLICVESEAVAVLSTARPCTIWPVTSLASLRRSASGPVHLIGHAFGNRIARCLAVDQPSLVCSGWSHRAPDAARDVLSQCDAGQDEWQRL